jgi:hypothetical protein
VHASFPSVGPVVTDRCAAFGETSSVHSVRNGMEKISPADPTQASRQSKKSPVPLNPYETVSSLASKFHASFWNERILKRTGSAVMYWVERTEKTVSPITLVTAASSSSKRTRCCTRARYLYNVILVTMYIKTQVCTSWTQLFTDGKQ